MLRGSEARVLASHPPHGSQRSHSGVIGSVFICVESRGRLRLYWPEPFALQQMSGSGSQSNGVETGSVGMADKEEQQGET